MTRKFLFKEGSLSARTRDLFEHEFAMEFIKRMNFKRHHDIIRTKPVLKYSHITFQGFRPASKKEFWGMYNKDFDENYTMTNKEILIKAIDKAISNGYKTGYSFWDSGNIMMNDYDGPSPFDVIYSHGFAKAFFGEEYAGRSFDFTATDQFPDLKERKAWEIHLQRMVLSEDPIKYLEQYL